MLQQRADSQDIQAEARKGVPGPGHRQEVQRQDPLLRPASRAYQIQMSIVVSSSSLGTLNQCALISYLLFFISYIIYIYIQFERYICAYVYKVTGLTQY